MQSSKIRLLISMLALSLALLSFGCKKADAPANETTEAEAQALQAADEAAAQAAADEATAADSAAEDHAADDCGCDKAGEECGCDKGAEHDCGCDNADGECGCAAGDHAGHGHGEGDHAGHDHGEHAADGAAVDIMDLVLKEGSYDESKVVRQPDAKIGDLTRCTVSGEAFVVTDAHPHVSFEGKEVYFCCPGCIRRFQRNPQSYIDGQK